MKAQLNYAVSWPLGSQLFSRPTIILIRKFKTRSSRAAVLHCPGHVVTGSPVFAQVGSEQPCEVGGWEPCPEHRWASQAEQAQKRLVCPGALGAPPPTEEWPAGRPPATVAGHFRAAVNPRLLLAPPTCCRGVPSNRRSGPLSQQSREIAYNTIPWYTAKNNPN